MIPFDAEIQKHRESEKWREKYINISALCNKMSLIAELYVSILDYVARNVSTVFVNVSTFVGSLHTNFPIQNYVFERCVMSQLLFACLLTCMRSYNFLSSFTHNFICQTRMENGKIFTQSTN